MNNCTACQVPIETAKLGMLVCGIVLALVIILNIDSVRHWWVRQIWRILRRF